ncbi:MAG: HEAT repeat domain-containing protein [Verrucomicrobiae bacterium]|nr:HEAT repeat domain-containing protein [Verrucomicrobiae bacterium]
MNLQAAAAAFTLVLTTGLVVGGVVTIGPVTFTVPEGFTVELAAGADLAPRPVSACFDDQGHLYVTDSSGSNKPPAEQLKDPDHRILRLADRDGDGVFDDAVVFADRVMFPQGCLWHEGSVYVAAPPSLWKFTDTDGDGIADRREEWFRGGTLTGCANDLHGPHLGPDGWLYWTKGAFAEQTHPLGSGRTLQDRAAHIYRARPDGTGLEVVMSGGMDNPVEVAFTADGEAVFTSTFIDFSQPGFRDGIAHAIQGGVFGKANEVLEDGRVVRTGPELFHPFYQAGPSAECGLARYTGTAFGPGYRDNLFATSFNLHKVTRHTLRPDGASLACDSADFMTTDHPDFHPTDVLEDADGSLLVVDTGGWYKLCCPSSQLVKPDVLGAIYRVRRQGAERAKDLWGRAQRPAVSDAGGLETALRGLSDESWAIRDAAARWLVRIGNPAVDGLRRMAAAPGAGGAGQEPLWTLFKIGTPAASAVLVQALEHPDPLSRRVAAKALSLQPDLEVAAPLTQLLRAEDPALVRSGAEGLGRLGAREAVPALLSAAGRPAVDPFLQHSLIHALIRIGDGAETRKGLGAPSATARRAALIALDQMEAGGLTVAELTPFLDDPDERTRTAADWIVSSRAEWGGELAALFRSRLRDHGPGDLGSWNRRLALLTRDAQGRGLLAEAAGDPGWDPTTREAALQAMSAARLTEPPEGWEAAVCAALSEPAGPVRRAAIAASRSMSGSAGIAGALRSCARDEALPAALRLEALDALAAGTVLSGPEFSFLLTQLDPGNPPQLRAAAARVISRSAWAPSELSVLAGRIPEAGPLELALMLSAFDGGGDEALGRQLLAALRASPSARALHPGQWTPRFAKFPEPVREEAAAHIASIHTDAASQAARLDVLLESLQQMKGDIRRGQEVFNGARAACASCHRIGYLGGDVGPELTRIGEVRSERDLLESIVYPSLSFVRSYEPTRISLRDGEEIQGIVRSESSEEVTVVTGPGAVQRIRRSDIAAMEPGGISVMPGGLDEQLSRQELADLLLFVKAVRWQ